MNHQRLVLLAAGGAMVFGAMAADVPTFYLPGGDGKLLIEAMSDNGKWLLAETKGKEEGDINTAGGTLINFETKEEIAITHELGWAGVADVTDDGNIVVGELLGQAAYYNVPRGEWVYLEQPQGATGGRVLSVTPDGKRACGYTQPSPTEAAPSSFVYESAVWDLNTGKLIDTSAAIRIDLSGEDQIASKFSCITPDGRYVVGENGWFYASSLYGPEGLVFIYDIEEKTNTCLGFDYVNGEFITQNNKLANLSEPKLSTNGRWLTGFAYIVESETEFNTPFRYDLTNGELEIYYNGMEDSDIGGYAVLNDGTVLGATPAVSPYRFAKVRHNGYWYDMESLLEQVYDINIEAATGFARTGATLSCNGDGSVGAYIVSTTENYVMTLPEPISELCERVDLLGNWSVLPADGSVFSTLSMITLTFDRSIGLRGAGRNVHLLDEEGNSIATATNANVDGSRLTITFRSTQLAEGKKYTVRIPAGFVSLPNDSQMLSKEINITYTGRRDGAIQVTEIYPADGSYLARLDVTTDPILVNFDAQVSLADGAYASLYRNDEAEPFCSMGILYGQNQILVYPVIAQNLFLDSDYRVVIPQGTVTDLSGAGANDEIVITYHGTYQRNPIDDGPNIFFSSCDNYDDFMFYEGDNLVPASTPASWGFTQSTTPWFIVRGSEQSTDMALAAHSMYTPAGTANDWMVTPQLYIPDANCFLSFDAQSYLRGKEDRLTVYAYVSDNVYNTLTTPIIDEMRAKGDLIVDKILSPGESEEALEGDWEAVKVSLEKYAGQNIYIAFANENTNQSAIFIDNVTVKQDTKFGVLLDVPNYVDSLDEIDVKVTVIGTSDTDVFDSLEAKLLDANGETVSTQTMTGIDLGKDKRVEFTFDKALPLQHGVENKYSVEFVLTTAEGEKADATMTGAIKNLAFTPVRRVVLEEFTGKDCGNCPQGIVAIENLHKIYGDRFIPIAVKGYGGNDPLGMPVLDYAAFLGMSAAPSGRLNRGAIEYPMVSVNGVYSFSGAGVYDEAGVEQKVWLDYANEIMAELAEADVKATAVYPDDSDELTITANVCWALNTDNQSIGVFAVLLENDLKGLQQNYMYTIEDPIFGEWGKGGIYGTAWVANAPNDHVARATYGRTYNGTVGLIPSTLVAGETYEAVLTGTIPDFIQNRDKCQVAVMLIDNITGQVINSVCVPLSSASGVKGMNTTPVKVSTAAGQVIVEAPAGSKAELYDAAGRLVGRTAVNGRAVIATSAKGVGIVRVITDNNTVTRKVVLK
ncbi:MAG: Ig-like domain-containing protein [Muribaculaceae bacterium]|nr:Ig-like domain-containing protein [Muribaculaceae bacterium]